MPVAHRRATEKDPLGARHLMRSPSRDHGSFPTEASKGIGPASRCGSEASSSTTSRMIWLQPKLSPDGQSLLMMTRVGRTSW